MEKTSKVIKVGDIREWNNPKGGTIYYHTIALENGDEGQIGKKEKNAIKVGDELTYTIDGTKIKAVFAKPDFKGGKQNVSSFAMSYAKDLVVADKVDIKNLIPTADKIYDWLKSKS